MFSGGLAASSFGGAGKPEFHTDLLLEIEYPMFVARVAGYFRTSALYRRRGLLPHSPQYSLVHSLVRSHVSPALAVSPARARI